MQLWLRNGCRVAVTIVSVAARRKLDRDAGERIVAERGAGRSFRQIGALLGVCHSTVWRRVSGDPVLRARIAAAAKREARRARDRGRKARARAARKAAIGQGAAAGQRRPGLSSSRPHGRRDELRAEGRILRDLGASFEARAQARETLLELLEATRANGRPAYSLQLAAAKALMDDPAPFEPN